MRQILDKGFKPAIVELRKFRADVAKSENKQAIQEYFEKNAGGICCKDIRLAKITPCNRCVEIAAEAIEKLDT